MHQWVYLQSSFTGEKQIGPIPEADFVSLLKKGKIKLKTKVASTTRTKGRWLQAQQVSGIQKLLARFEQESIESKRKEVPKRVRLKAALEKEKHDSPSEHKAKKAKALKSTNPPPLIKPKLISTGLEDKQIIMSWIALAGLVMLCISPFLRWIKIGALGINGLAGDGKILLAISIIAAICFSFVVFKKTWLSLIVLPVQAFGVICTLWLGGLLWRLSNHDVPGTGMGIFAALLPSPGAGLWLGIVGGILVAGGAGLLAYECLSKSSKTTHFIATETIGIVLGLSIAIGLTNFPMPQTPFNSSDSPASPFSFASSGRKTTSPKEDIESLQFNKTFVKDNVALKLTGFDIKNPEVEDMFGELNIGKKPALVVSISFTNLDDRKILRFEEQNSFSPSNFKLRDDAGNAIRGIGYGVGSKIVGSLDGSEDILPGSTASHIEVFTVPPPKTKSLVLTIDLECVGRVGTVEFEIPAKVFFK